MQNKLSRMFLWHDGGGRLVGCSKPAEKQNKQN